MNVVLVHGLAGSSRWWRSIVPELEPRHHVDVVDLHRGDPLDAVAECANRAVLVGHSLGGLVCVRAALRHPERLRGLVLIAPVGVPLARSLTRSVAPLVRAVVAKPTTLVPLLVRDTLRIGPLGLVRGAATAVGADVREELASLHLPTLLVWGSRDPLVPAELAEEWHRALPDARLAVLEGVAHAPMLERPEALARELVRFLDEIEHESA